jgi:two-component system, sporulation sensor kinase E
MVGKSDDIGLISGRLHQIVVKTALVKSVIEISVIDNGPGISEENMHKIMEPLFTTKSFGVGLGLPAVQKIMQQHGGGLRVASTPGRGAEFTAWMPIVCPARDAA